MRSAHFSAIGVAFGMLSAVLPACQSLAPSALASAKGFCGVLRGTVLARTDTENKDVENIAVETLLPSDASPADLAAFRECVTSPHVGHNDVRWGPPQDIFTEGGVEYAKVGFEVDNIYFTPGGGTSVSTVVKGIRYLYRGPTSREDFTEAHPPKEIRPFSGNVIVREVP